MNHILVTLQSVLQDDILNQLKHQLKTEEYDTDSIVYDVNDEAQSSLHECCVRDTQTFRQVQETINKYLHAHKSHTFKEMDFALSNYYSLMGRTRDDYYNELRIGAFEIFCFHNGYIREQEIEMELQKQTLECILTTFDIDNFPLSSDLLDIDNDTKRHEIHSVLRNCLQNKHCYTLNHINDLSTKLRNDCASVTSCPSIVNICNALQFHAQTEDKNQVYEYFTQEYLNVVKDFHHILMKHLHKKNELQNNTHFQSIHAFISQKVECNVTKCDPFTRNNRNRASKEEHVQTETEEEEEDGLEYEYYVDLLDNIHCYFIHSYDTGFRLNADLNHQIYDDDEDDTDFDFDSNDVQKLYVDRAVKTLKVHLGSKRKNMNNPRTNTNKFVTTVHENKCEEQDDTETNTKTVKESDYAFGVRFYYWEWFKNNDYRDWRNQRDALCDWYIEQKYDNFKQEMLNCISMRDFNGVKLKATKLLSTSDVLKTMKSDFYYNANCHQLVHYGIPCGEPLKVSNIMTVLFYTDFSTISFEFSASFRRLNPNESDEALKARHREYYHWAKTLRETVELYGEYVHKTKTERFYHGVSFMYFDNFVNNFCGPTSTTAQLSVATIFSEGTGLVLELQQMPGIYSGNLKYFDCSLLSCYGNEDERLFIGGFQNLQFVSIHLMEKNQNMRWFIQSLALFAKVIRGWKLRKEHKLAIKKVNYRIIQELIEQRINSEYRNQFPEYINECFRRFCNEKAVVRFDIDALKTHYPGFHSDFMMSSDGVDVLKCDRIAQIFCNVKSIKVFFKEEISGKYLDGLIPMIGNVNTCTYALRVVVFSGKWPNGMIRSKQEMFTKLKWKISQKKSEDRKRQFGTKRLFIEKI